MAKMHKATLRILAEDLKTFRDLSENTKVMIIKRASLELVILRAASCATENAVKSLNGMVYGKDTLLQGGASSETVSFLYEYISSIRKMKLDDETFSLIAGICLMSADREGISEREALHGFQVHLLRRLKNNTVGTFFSCDISIPTPDPMRLRILSFKLSMLYVGGVQLSALRCRKRKKFILYLI